MAGAESSPKQASFRRISPELAARIGSAIVLGVIALLATWTGGWPFALLWLAAGLAILAEWTAMTRVAPRLVLQGLLWIGLLALFAVYVARLPIAAGALVVAATALLGALAGATWRDRLWAIGGFAYAAVIVLAPQMVREHGQAGLVGVLWMFAVVWTTDIAAYFTGRSLGGPKIWPRISPKKTWSGFLGGLAAGALAGLAVVQLGRRWGAFPAVGIGAPLLASAIASILGQLGDLAESALKRYFQVKDSSHLIPGHGGVMDRLDGFWPVTLLAAAVAGARAAGP
jgi:phosphatidate cytidylyltransferase